MTIKQDYVAVGRGKREQRDRLIPVEWRIKPVKKNVTNVIDVPVECGLLSERELAITSDHDAIDILEKIKTNQYTAENVTRAFCKRAAIAQQLVYTSSIKLDRKLIPFLDELSD